MSDKRDVIMELFRNAYDSKIGTEYYISTGIKNVPICKSEDAYEKTLPVAVLSHVSTAAGIADIGGKNLLNRHLIDCNVYIQRTAEYDWQELLSEVCNEIINKIS